MLSNLSRTAWLENTLHLFALQQIQVCRLFSLGGYLNVDLGS
jgi:hypothetical protein